MTPEQLSTAIRDALTEIVATDRLGVEVPAEVRVERPRNRDHGDWSTNIALQLAKKADLAPRDLADMLAARLRELAGIASVETAGPGFLNIVLDAAAAGEIARTIVSTGRAYGTNESLAGHTINLEYVSANPTGPLHIGHTRWAALGDALRRILAASGADVTAEYYVNDSGVQMERFGASILARIRGEDVPEGGYQGEYIKEIAAKIVAASPNIRDFDPAEALPVARDDGYALQFGEIKQVLDDFGVHFDVFFSEQELHDTSAVKDAVERLRQQGHVDDRDGAVWLRTTEFGDDKDRVLTRSDGSPTYFAADAAYYLSKKDRGFTEKIYLLGADHHGYVHRLQALAACAGDDPATNIEILIGQLVSVGGAKMSKRLGHIVELRDLLRWIGADAVRYTLARYPADSPLELNGEDLRRRSADNPVFYVQYAHARTVNVGRNAAEHGVRRDEGFVPALLAHPSEEVVLATLAAFPGTVSKAGELREPHRVARYLENLASAYHKWYDSCRVTPLGDEAVGDVHRSRLWLNDATRTVLANGLDLLGVSAPERM